MVPTEVRFDFTDGHAQLEARVGFLHVVEHGFVATVENMQAYCRAVEDEARGASLEGILIDTRQTLLPDPAAEHWKAIRDVRWRAMSRSQLRFAFVLRDDMAATRVTMSARSTRVRGRGFTEPRSALRWLRSGDTQL